MAKIKPFRATIYNQEKIKALSQVVCPPYDVISKPKQEYYHNLSPYNLTHILLGKDLLGEDKYKRAGNFFREWLKNKILIQEVTSAIYLYSQQYKLKGEKRTRLGFISLLRLDEKDSSIFGHEHTQLEPKEDRLRLLREVKTNLSPIFVIFTDKQRIIHRAFQDYIQDSSLLIDIIDDEKITHKLWRLDSPSKLAAIEKALSNEKLFIADGHHRYEVACAFRDEMKQKLENTSSGKEDFNYILAYFTNLDPRGLSILPIHRLVKLNPLQDSNNFFSSLSEYFHIEEIKERNKFFFMMERGGRTEHVLGVYKDKTFRLLRLKNIKILDKLLSDKPKIYRSLDISILNSIVLENFLGMNTEDKGSIKFSPEPDEFIEAVDCDPKNIAFFLNAVKVQQIISLALNGERMPAKSTYFYPKVLSGLVINKFE